jgi:hypothetical protein
MKKLLFILTFLLISNFAISQGLFITGNVYVIMTSSVHIVIDRQAADGITRTGGGIINKDNNEANYVDWIIKNGAIGSYTVPWTTSAQYIPFTYAVTTPGSNDGRMLFSTWQVQTDNTTPVAIGATGWPTGVTNVLPDPLYAADRFYWIKYSGYGTKPVASLTFSYVDPTEYQAPNTIIETDLQAQYWDNTLATPGWVTPGTGSQASNYVNGVSSISFDSPWVLVSKKSFLPIEIDEFYAECSNSHVAIYWSTVSETNNDYFTLERSDNTTDWNYVTTVAGAGNSNETVYYSYIDEIMSNDVYYRLKQIDYDGKFSYTSMININCDNDAQEVLMYPNPIIDEFIISIKNLNCDTADINFYNNAGQLVYIKKLYDLTNNKKQTINMSSLAEGIYFVNFNCTKYFKTQKFLKN